MFPGLSDFRKHGLLVFSPIEKMARKQCFLVYPPSGNMARKQCFLVCLPSGNMARKQCFLVCPLSSKNIPRNITLKTMFQLVFLMTRMAFKITPLPASLITKLESGYHSLHRDPTICFRPQQAIRTLRFQLQIHSLDQVK